MKVWNWELVSLWLLCVALTGCGSGVSSLPGLVPVTGTVTYKGQPVSSGSIAFVAADGKTTYTGLIENGHYKLAASPSSPGAAPGDYRVGVSGPSASMDEKGQPVPASNSLPAKFSATATSGLSATVPPQGGEVNIEIKD